jgi:multisubunit Na+/H+ antiporter MnhG subunit
MSSADIADPGHGHSPAAWVAVIIMMIAFAVGVFAFWFELVWLFWVAVGLVVLGPVVGWILAKAGYGVAGPRYQPKKTH